MSSQERKLISVLHQGYVEHLARVSEEALETAGVKIVVIGCGEWNPIKSYAGMACLAHSL